MRRCSGTGQFEEALIAFLLKSLRHLSTVARSRNSEAVPDFVAQKLMLHIPLQPKALHHLFGKHSSSTSIVKKLFSKA